MDKIKELFDLCGLDCILLKTSERVADPNFYYFTKLSKFENFSSILVLRRGRKPVVLANVLEYKNVEKSRQFSAVRISSAEDAAKVLKKMLPRKVGINYTTISLKSLKDFRSLLKGKKFLDVSQALGKIRETKTNEELKKLEKSCKIAAKIIESVPNMAKVGMQERELEKKIEEMIELHDVEFSFPPIVASGANSSVPHHVTSSKKIRRGEVLLVDIGAAFENYCSDITRTFYVGRADDEVKNAYDVVRRSQEAALHAIKQGAKTVDVFGVSEKILKVELKQPLIHSLGHGIGVEVHDFPEGLSPKSKYILKENMALAIEPAYYGKKYGIRIEDDVVVTRSGCKLLTKSPKDLVEI